MILYEIFADTSSISSFYSFESAYQYKENQRLFVEKDNAIYVCRIKSITGDLTKKTPTTRLNCHVTRYQN